MKIKIGVMGSSAEPETGSAGDAITEKAIALGRSLAGHDIILLTGATTGVVYKVGKAARDAGVFHVGVSPGGSQSEHIKHYKLPIDACDLLIYTGFGLKGRNVVLVRSCDIAIFIGGTMGSLNEFTIAHDEGKVIGCLTHTGGVADEVEYLQEKFAKETGARVVANADPAKLVVACIRELAALTIN